MNEPRLHSYYTSAIRPCHPYDKTFCKNGTEFTQNAMETILLTKKAVPPKLTSFRENK